SSVTVSGTGVLGIDLVNNSTFTQGIVLNGTTASVQGLEQSSVTNTISGTISGTGSFTQAGPGTTVFLTGVDETYTGATNVSAGTLEVDGSTVTASTVNVGAAGTLTGSGTI